MPAWNQSLAWWHSERDELPDASALGANAWGRFGVGTTALQTTHGGGVRVTAAGATLGYKRLPHPDDRAGRAPRAADDLSWQGTIRGYSQAPGWASGASPIAVVLSDGARTLALSVGPSLQLIDPATGAVVALISDRWNWDGSHSYRFRLVGSELWEVWVDGRLLHQAGYLDSAAVPSGLGDLSWGLIDPAGSADALFQGVEACLNVSLPREEDLRRAHLELLPADRQASTVITRGLLRSCIGLAEQSVDWLRRASRALGASRIPSAGASFSFSSRRPGDESPAWIEVQPARISLVRDRVRFDGRAAVEVAARSAFPAAAHLPADREIRVSARVLLQGYYTPDAQGRVGPYLQASNGRVVNAILVEDGKTTAGDAHAWILVGDNFSGAIVQIGSARHRVDPRQAHTVELRILGEAVVLLLIDGEIVDRIPYALLLDSLAERVGIGVCAAPLATLDAWAATGERTVCDLVTRPVFEESVKERTLAIGGCERNDELEIWQRHHHGVQARRGTTQGIVVELKRLACTESVVIVTAPVFAYWVLEVTYPEVTPIFLELDQTYSVVVVECGWGQPPNLTLESFAAHAARYLLPSSTIELSWALCLATGITAPLTVPGPGLTRIPVTSSTGFNAGDTVTLRDTATSATEERVIDSIVSATAIDVDTVAGAFGASDVLRRLLITT